MQITRPAIDTDRLARIAAVLPDDTLVANMEKLSATFDSFAAEKLDVDDPALSQDRALYEALRQEFRNRSGEVI